jgi:signal transduction histidine kinase
VDDVLSFSKLDASMLSLRPKPSRPSRQLASTLKMFEPELRKQNMDFSFCVDTTYEDCEVGTVMADLLRIRQVVVNLISNAIKFTARRDGEKKITVSVAASRTRYVL